VRYAAYGSNLHPLRLQQRTPSARLLGTSYHPDYSLRFEKWSLDGSGKCGIFEGSSGVHFAVYELDPGEKPILDRVEGVGLGYEVKTLELPDYGECFTYVPASSHVRNELEPYSWYHEIVLLGCEAHGFPDDYVSRLRRQPTTRDPDANRRKLNQQLIELLKERNRL